MLWYSRPGDGGAGGAHWMRIVVLDHRLGSVIRVVERLETD